MWRIGRGLHSLNPLDAGPLRAAVAQTRVGTERDRLRETIRARRLSLLEALVVIVRRGEITVTERRLLDVALDLAVQPAQPGTAEPTIPDVVRVLTNPPAELSIAACADVAEFRRDARDLLNTLGLLCEGAIRGMFDRPSSITADLDTPALSLDISALDDDEDEVVAAAMLSSWAWAAAVIDGSAASGGGATCCGCRTSCGGRCGWRPGWWNARTGSPAWAGTAARCPCRSPTPSTTSKRCPPRPTGPRPAAWPPATGSWCSAGWPTRNSTASVGSPR